MTAAACFAPTEIVTVARAGSKITPYGHPIYCTAVYRAVARKRDGVRTWRRVGSVPASDTAGRRVTKPMADRAADHARQTGRRFEYGVRHGMIVR